MQRRTFTRICLLLAGLGLAGSLLSSAQTPDDNHRGRKYKTPPPASRIEVTVLRDVNGKPVENAAVIFHPIEGDRDKGIMELKTNEEGKCIIDVIPVGDTVRMQIIARGFQTTGQDFKVDKDALKFEVRLRRPGEQFSIYKAHPEGDNQPTPPADAPDKPATPPAAK